MRIKVLALCILFCGAGLSQVTKELPTNRERGLDLSMYTACWQDSDMAISHGGLIERPIMTPGDPQHISKRGAMLVYANKFSRATLEPESQTQKTKHADQEILSRLSG